MPPERGRRVPPPKEHEPSPPYYRAARYDDEQSAGLAYTQAQELIRIEPCDLSVFRILLDTDWHVAVFGVSPARIVDQHIATILAGGAAVELQVPVLDELQRRRSVASAVAPWVEIHRHHRKGPGGR